MSREGQRRGRTREMKTAGKEFQRGWYLDWQAGQRERVSYEAGKE